MNDDDSKELAEYRRIAGKHARHMVGPQPPLTQRLEATLEHHACIRERAAIRDHKIEAIVAAVRRTAENEPMLRFLVSFVESIAGDAETWSRISRT